MQVASGALASRIVPPNAELSASVAQRRSRARRASLALTIAVVAIGVAGLTGWAAESRVLKSISPGLSQMKANTALCFVLIGTSLALLWPGADGRVRLGGRTLAALAALVGIATFAEYALGWKLGIDQLLFEDAGMALGTPAPGRMGANTSIGFAIAGLSLLALDARWSAFRPAQAGALTIGAIALPGYSATPTRSPTSRSRLSPPT